MKVKKNSPSNVNSTFTNYQKIKSSDSVPCQKCLYLEEEILSCLQTTDDYKRSLAISEAFKFLLKKIEHLEDKNKELRKRNIDLEENVNNSIKEIDAVKTKFALFKEDCDTKEFLLKNKIDALNTINSTLEINIKKLEEELIDTHKSKDEKERADNKTISELENQLYRSKSECGKLQTEVKELEESFTKNESAHRVQMADLEYLYKNEISQLKERETMLNQKLKESELHRHKLEMENQDYRDCIRTVNKKPKSDCNTAYTASFNNKNESFIKQPCKTINNSKLDIKADLENLLTTQKNTSTSNIDNSQNEVDDSCIFLPTNPNINTNTINTINMTTISSSVSKGLEE